MMVLTKNMIKWYIFESAYDQPEINIMYILLWHSSGEK